MKKKLFYTVLIILVAAVSITSCRIVDERKNRLPSPDGEYVLIAFDDGIYSKIFVIMEANTGEELEYEFATMRFPTKWTVKAYWGKNTNDLFVLSHDIGVYYYRYNNDGTWSKDGEYDVELYKDAAGSTQARLVYCPMYTTVGDYDLENIPDEVLKYLENIPETAREFIKQIEGFAINNYRIPDDAKRYTLEELRTFFSHNYPVIADSPDNDFFSLTLDNIHKRFPIVFLRCEKGKMPYIAYPVKEGGTFIVFLNLKPKDEMTETDYYSLTYYYASGTYYSNLSDRGILSELSVGMSYHDVIDLLPQSAFLTLLSSAVARSWTPLDDRSILWCEYQKQGDDLVLTDWTVEPWKQEDSYVLEYDIWS